MLIKAGVFTFREGCVVRNGCLVVGVCSVPAGCWRGATPFGGWGCRSFWRSPRSAGSWRRARNLCGKGGGGHEVSYSGEFPNPPGAVGDEAWFRAGLVVARCDGLFFIVVRTLLSSLHTTQHRPSTRGHTTNGQR